MKSICICVIFFNYAITSLIAQKPTITALDTSLYIDINKYGIKQKNEAVGAKLEITDIGFDKENTYSKENYFIDFQLTNTGQVDI